MVEYKNVDGDIIIPDVDGNLNDPAIDGDVHVYNIEGDISQANVDGNISSEGNVEGEASGAMFITEVDPTVPAWAKQPVKPEYEYEEIDDKPSINDVTVQGGKTGYDYHLQNELDFATVHDVERILYTN